VSQNWYTMFYIIHDLPMVFDHLFPLGNFVPYLYPKLVYYARSVTS
jgi:hypothetical protein